MTTSETTAFIAKALSAAQGQMRAAEKGSINKHLGNRYADIASVWDVCRAPLAANGLALVQTIGWESPSIVLETRLLHVSGEWIEGRYPVKPTKDDPQGLGSAITYARRYSLMAMVGVVADEDDDGHAESEPTEPSNREAERRKDELVQRVLALRARIGIPNDVMRHVVGIMGYKVLNNMTVPALQGLVKGLAAIEQAIGDGKATKDEVIDRLQATPEGGGSSLAALLAWLKKGTAA